MKGAHFALLKERIRSKLPPGNITKEERKAIHTLKNDKTITIIPADKGRVTVVMDTKCYEQKMEDMLKDTDTYEIMKKDPTEEKKKPLKVLLKPLLAEEKIDKDTYNHLIPTANITPRIYGTPKIRRKDAPLRPVVDSIGSVTYNLSKALVDLIKPLVGQSNQHCKNSRQLVEESKTFKYAQMKS
uniref:Reverse transcriptase domain-containing protein n=1 Tax=Salarias fasciatus TaxID=181472 RepID=A0A672HDU0_SALFA